MSAPMPAASPVKGSSRPTRTGPAGTAGSDAGTGSPVDCGEVGSVVCCGDEHAASRPARLQAAMVKTARTRDTSDPDRRPSADVAQASGPSPAGQPAGQLAVIATPIGNLGDVSPRAREV